MLSPDVVLAVAGVTSGRKRRTALPVYESDEEAAAAGERSVRRVRLPEHLRQDRACVDPIAHGASRARPHDSG